MECTVMTDLKSVARRLACSIIECEEFRIYTETVTEPTHITYGWFEERDLETGTYYRVSDYQGANLGDIESEYFDSLADVISRMETYHIDYFFSDLTDCYEEYGDSIDTDDVWLWEVACTKALASSVFYDLLSDTPCDEDIASQEITDDEIKIFRSFVCSVEPELSTRRDF